MSFLVRTGLKNQKDGSGKKGGRAAGFIRKGAALRWKNLEERGGEIRRDLKYGGCGASPQGDLGQIFCIKAELAFARIAVRRRAVLMAMMVLTGRRSGDVLRKMYAGMLGYKQLRRQHNLQHEETDNSFSKAHADRKDQVRPKIKIKGF
jgi:hypothetical protein